MGCGNKVVSDRPNGRKNDKFVCGCRKENGERDESFRHCGCLDCRRRRHEEANTVAKDNYLI